MADNVGYTPGTGATVAADEVGGALYQRVKVTTGADGTANDVSDANPMPISGSVGVTGSVPVTGVPVPYWPGYSGNDESGPRSLGVDDSGALSARAAVLTDEGTFRLNFANTSFALDIGSVTVSGTTVTGTGFLTSDVHYHDYFKLSADGESSWVQIASIDSNTQLTLVSGYVGSASGTGQRTIMKPLTGSGGSITVGSGQGTLASGTTSNAVTGFKRFTDYAPLIFRSRVSISQRIANQDIHIGLEEDVTNPRWFARFLADGTTNTTIKCETGRNPSGLPSASETETTTVTLPNGANTSTMQDYRVELLTESVRFFIAGVLVAEHTRVIPHQHDEMTSHVEIRNGTSPASTTSVVIDYVTGKNHNKLEAGIMSDGEKILASQPPMQAFNYSQAGVIVINTDLLVIDCSQIRSLSIQCTSMGTSGVVTPAWSNDGVTYVNNSIMTTAGVAAATFNAAGLWSTQVYGRYLRLRLTTATTAGTTTLVVNGTQFPVSQPVVQPVSGSVTATVASTTLGAAVANVGYVGLQIPLTVADVASAALTTTTTTAAFTPAFGTTYIVNVPVTAVTGTTPTLDIGVEESDDSGTNWYRVYDFPRITATGSYRSPPLTLRGNRVRYVQTVSGTTPSFTRAINRLQRSDDAPLRMQGIDRTIVPNTLNSTSATYYIEGCMDFNLNVRCTAQTTPATIALSFSADGTNFFTSATTLATVVGIAQAKYTNELWKFARAIVTVAGSGITLGEAIITGKGS